MKYIVGEKPVFCFCFSTFFPSLSLSLSIKHAHTQTSFNQVGLMWDITFFQPVFGEACQHLNVRTTYYAFCFLPFSPFQRSTGWQYKGKKHFTFYFNSFIDIKPAKSKAEQNILILNKISLTFSTKCQSSPIYTLGLRQDQEQCKFHLLVIILLLLLCQQ